MFCRKARALGFPHWQTFTASDEQAYRTLVVWLEDTKIRHLEPAERQALRRIEEQNWGQTFQHYLEALECSRPFAADMSPQQRGVVLDFLLSLAVGAEFADHKAELNMNVLAAPAVGGQRSADATASQQPARSSQQQQQQQQPKSQHSRPTPPRVDLPALDCSAPDFSHAVHELATALSIPVALGAQRPSDSALLQAIFQRVRENKLHIQPLSQAEALSLLDRTQMGFKTNDVSVDRAATLLRLLYLEDLRAVQSLINQQLARAQAFTADPKTDSSLGKVGTG
eukprot:g13947.t1